MDSRARLQVVVTVAMLSTAGPFAVDAEFPGFSRPGSQFAASEAAVQQVTSAYLPSFATVPIMGGRLTGAGSWPALFPFLACYGLALMSLVVFGLPGTLPPGAHPAADRLSLDGPSHGRQARGFHGTGDRGLLRIRRAFPPYRRCPGPHRAGAPARRQRFLGIAAPMTGGMVAGSVLNSRPASRTDPARLASAGLGAFVAAGTLNATPPSLEIAAVLPGPVPGPVLIAFGIAMAFPVPQPRMLGLFPARRGAASMQSFTMLLMSAAVAGLVTPLVSSDVRTIASASGGFSLVSAELWLWHLTDSRIGVTRD